MKKILTNISLLILCLALLASNFGFVNFALAKDLDNLNDFDKKDEILVKYKNESDVVKIEVSNNNLDEVLNFYKSDPDVEYVEPNAWYQISMLPNDIYYDKQWYFSKIKAPFAWEIANKSEEVVVAVIDSGIQIDHPDLQNNIWHNQDEIPNNGIDDDNNGFMDDYNGWDFINNSNDPSPKFEEGFTESGILHGTIIAGIISASGNNNKGVTGVTWKSQIMPLRVLNDKGAGRTSEVIRAIDYATKNGADVINLSFVGFDYSQGLNEAIRRAYNEGILIVAAAGNEQDAGEGYNLDKIPMYPACNDGDNGENMVIGVAATDSIDQKAHFSSYGYNCVDISAPGVSIFSTATYAPNKSYEGNYFNSHYSGYWSGTSMATPMVAGAIALIKEVNPSLNDKEIKQILFDNADNITRLNPSYVGKLGAGRLNLYASLSAALKELENFSTKISVAPQSDFESQIKITDSKGEEDFDFLAFNPDFKGGVNITSGDLDGDGQDEIIIGAGIGGGPQVRIFNSQGKVLGQFFAFKENLRGGVNIATGDLDGDGQDEIIAGTGLGSAPLVRVFNSKGELLEQFFAYNNNFQGGIKVASGDLDGDGQDEIITGAGTGGGPQIRIFNSQGKVLGQFFAYDKDFRGGINIKVSNVIKKGRSSQEEIIVSPMQGLEPIVKVFDSHANLLSSFHAYNEEFYGGVNIGTGDINNDGLDEIVTGAGTGGGPHVRLFSGEGTVLGGFYAFEENFQGGVKVSMFRSK